MELVFVLLDKLQSDPKSKNMQLKKYCLHNFDCKLLLNYAPNYKLTIGVDFAVKVLDWDESTVVSLQLWDVAGHERFGTMTRVYYKYAIAAIIVFDVSRPATFEAVLKWRDDVNSKVVLANGQPIPCLLLANKCDISGVTVDKRALDQFAKDNNFIAWYPTSAQNNINIDDAVKFLVGKILEIETTNLPQPPADTATVQLAERDDEARRERKAENESCVDQCFT